MVPELSIVFMAVAFVFIFFIAIAMPVFIRKKWHTAISPYFIGCAVFLIFALILESIMHLIVLQSTGNLITGNMWLYALYGGLAAGVFEETGRFLAMKVVLKKHHDIPHNALMYGAGHGCFEAVAIVGTAMVNNIVYSVMINAGQMDALLSELPAEQQEAMQTVITQLTDASSYLYLLTGFERISAIILHLSFSVLVWTAVVRKKPLFYPLAIFIHAFVDALLVILQRSGVENIILEIIVFLMSLAAAAISYLVWKKVLCSQTENLRTDN